MILLKRILAVKILSKIGPQSIGVCVTISVPESHQFTLLKKAVIMGALVIAVKEDVLTSETFH